MNSVEARKRYVLKGKEASWTWPDHLLEYKDIHKLMAILLEISVNHFFKSFVYTYGGEFYLQGEGGPIGARLTMCVARLVLQDWYEGFKDILQKSSITEHLRGLYVDDGRNCVDILPLGTRFVRETACFEYKEVWKQEDEELNLNRRDLSEKEIREAMNSINPDLTFTTETENDFENLRLPTLSFQLWSDKTGLRFSYFEKSMRSQLLTMSRSSQSEKSKISILVNELNRRLSMVDENVSEEERVEIVDHFTQQLINSEYSEKQITEIILSSLKGNMKRERMMMERGYVDRKNKEETLRSHIMV